jgi:acyl carrier protein
MDNINERLATCFRNVFPDLQADEIPRASTASVPDWDSVTHITLLSAIAEEFEVEFAAEDFEELTSFLLIADYLHARTSHHA